MSDEKKFTEKEIISAVLTEMDSRKSENRDKVYGLEIVENYVIAVVSHALRNLSS